MEVRRPKCTFCDREAVVSVPYARLRLCEVHFEEFLLKRVKKVPLPKRLLMGLSGGKDSAVALYLLKKAGVDVVSATVDTVPHYTTIEGEVSRELSEELGVEHIMVYAKELYGFTAHSHKRLRRKPCSLCSKLRRHALEMLARRLKVDYIATGHNMDDMASLALASFLRGRLEDLKSVRPVEPPKGVARGRVRPLFWISEKEIMAFAITRGLPWLKASCPLYEPSSTFVDHAKMMLLEMEERFPGTRINLLRAALSVASDDDAQPNVCKICGGPSWGEVCSVCRLRSRLKGVSENTKEPKVEVKGEGDVLVVGQGYYFWTDVGAPRRGIDVLKRLGLGPERAVLVHCSKPLPPESYLKGEPRRGELVVYVLPRIKVKPNQPRPS